MSDSLTAPIAVRSSCVGMKLLEVVCCDRAERIWLRRFARTPECLSRASEDRKVQTKPARPTRMLLCVTPFDHDERCRRRPRQLRDIRMDFGADVRTVPELHSLLD